MVYTNDSDLGTGGGAILDSKGRLIGIHSGFESELHIDEDGNYQQILLGYSIGVSVRNLLTLIESEQIKLESKLLNIESDLPNITKAQIKDIQQQTQVAIAPAANSNPSEYLNYGNQLWRYQKYDKAIAALETAIKLDPGFDRAYYSLGLAAKDSGNYQQAVTAFKKATELNDSVGYYWRNLGLVYSLLQQYDRALEAYNRAIALNTSQQQPNSILNLERDRILDRIDNQ